MEKRERGKRNPTRRRKEKRILPSALADGLTVVHVFLPPLTKGGTRGVNDCLMTAKPNDYLMTAKPNDYKLIN